jgi:hypothetical protein
MIEQIAEASGSNGGIQHFRRTPGAEKRPTGPSVAKFTTTFEGSSRGHAGG